MKQRNEGYAVVLTGDAAKGSFQAGVLQTLSRAGVKINLVVGTSIGAVNSILFTCGTDPVQTWRAYLSSGRNIYRLRKTQLGLFLLSSLAHGFLIVLATVLVALTTIVPLLLAVLALEHLFPQFLGWELPVHVPGSDWGIVGRAALLLFLMMVTGEYLLHVLPRVYQFGTSVRRWLWWRILSQSPVSLFDLRPLRECSLPLIMAYLRARQLGGMVTSLRQWMWLRMKARMAASFGLRPAPGPEGLEQLWQRQREAREGIPHAICRDLLYLLRVFTKYVFGRFVRYSPSSRWLVVRTPKPNPLLRPGEEPQDLSLPELIRRRHRLSNEAGLITFGSKSTRPSPPNAVITAVDVESGELELFYVGAPEFEESFEKDESPIVQIGRPRKMQDDRDLVTALLASSAIPGAFAPVALTLNGGQERLLVDGAVKSRQLLKIPVALGYKRIILVTTQLGSEAGKDEAKRGERKAIGNALDILITDGVEASLSDVEGLEDVGHQVVTPSFEICGGLLGFSEGNTLVNVLNGKQATCSALRQQDIAAHHPFPVCGCLGRAPFREPLMHGEIVLASFEAWEPHLIQGVFTRVRESRFAVLVTEKRIVGVKSNDACFDLEERVDEEREMWVPVGSPVAVEWFAFNSTCDMRPIGRWRIRLEEEGEVRIIVTRKAALEVERIKALWNAVSRGGETAGQGGNR